MVRYRYILLALVLLSTSGYRFRCWWACTDQTAIQHDYVERRDHCRSYAQLKLDMVVRNRELDKPKSRKEQLINLFSECMEKKGWDIPSGREKEDEEKKKEEDAKVAHLTKEEKVQRKQTKKWALSRRSECAFARHAAGHSSIQRARARACDLECGQRVKEAPDSPLPAACPSKANPAYATGVERTNE